jgi:hypothetical protein
MNVKEQFLASSDDLKGLKQEPKSRRSAVMIIAVSPRSDFKYKSLWSQLECFTPSDKIQKIIIAAPGWTGKTKNLQLFIQSAIEKIPHLKDSNIVLKRYMNDRHDVGLWCDALKDTSEPLIHPLPTTELFDDFILINDSLFALVKNYTGVLDVLRQEDLNMTSLNFSFLHGDKKVGTSLPPEWVYGRQDHMWVESTFRAFNREGIKTFMKHACVPAYHPHFCPSVLKRSHRKRCIVESMEMRISSLYDQCQVKGLFPSDAPEDISHEGIMWHTNFKLWEKLYTTQRFPVFKVTSSVLMDALQERGQESIFQVCNHFLDETALNSYTGSK